MGKELLFSITKKDLEIKAVRGSGPGGQHRNKVATGIRMTHIASGATVVATDSRSQKGNMRSALHRIVGTPKFKLWYNEAVRVALGEKSIQAAVDQAMDINNLKVEIRDNDGRWVIWKI